MQVRLYNLNDSLKETSFHYVTETKREGYFVMIVFSRCASSLFYNNLDTFFIKLVLTEMRFCFGTSSCLDFLFTRVSSRSKIEITYKVIFNCKFINLLREGFENVCFKRLLNNFPKSLY